LAFREARAGIISLYREIGQTDFPISVVFTDASGDLGEVHPPSMETVLVQHPEMQLAHEVVERAEANLALQHANAVVDPNLILGYKRFSGNDPQNPGINTLYFGVQVQLPVFSRNQGRIAAAEADLRGARAELKAQEIAIRSEVAAALDDYTTRREALLQIIPRMNDQAAETFSITERAYRLGGTNILRFLDAERARIETAVLYQQVLTGYHQSVVKSEADDWYAAVRLAGRGLLVTIGMCSLLATACTRGRVQSGGGQASQLPANFLRISTEYLTSIDAAMTGQHSEVRVHQHRNIEAEGLNATRDLADLSWAVHTRVVGVQLQLEQRTVDDRDAAFSPGLEERRFFDSACMLRYS
jgi:hypothetical protein